MNKKGFAGVLAVLFVMFLFAACGESEPVVPVSQPTTDESADEAIDEDSAIEIEVGQDEVKSEGWSSAIPSDVPVFKYGKIDASAGGQELGSGFMVQITDAEEGAVDKYLDDLISAGFTIDTPISEGSSPREMATKGNLIVAVDRDPVGENTVWVWVEISQ
ncbi:MAG: hypothetical protein WC604_01655 [Candidatus Gracilibacteria bacterium]